MGEPEQKGWDFSFFFLRYNCQFLVAEASWLSLEDPKVPKPYNLACQGLAQEGPSEGPACFLGAAGPLSMPSLVVAAANSSPQT